MSSAPSPQASTTRLVHFEELWFTDGNVVLQAGDRLFCVYRGFLASLSSVLSDMFSFPQPSDVECYDGKPLIVFHDPPGEFVHFLKAIFMPTYFLPPPTKTTFEVLDGVLRLSDKYDVAHLRQRAMHHLSTWFGTTVEQYFADNETATFKLPGLKGYVAVASLATQVHAAWALPQCYYDLTTTSIDEVLRQGCHVLNGTTRQLSEADIIAISNGFRATRRSSPAMRLLEHSDICGDPGCLGSRVRLAMDAAEDWMVDPLEAREVWMEYMGTFTCPECFEKCSESMRSWEVGFWENLPAAFALPPWPELQRMKAADLGG
ncbi:hypothetical protein BD626DRAFT_582101 [Schizophyllum amplum]|uniref:BTB domain-containing protein n=1 Tax=Schizophyllum amplum TaxID=97359 RepID=A0A550CMN8_9AGAR|nr:hypothetical protein BD626DRAFT_582101 [Auriculariopsis ampla]